MENILHLMKNETLYFIMQNKNLWLSNYATAKFFRPQCQRFDIERNVDIWTLVLIWRRISYKISSKKFHIGRILVPGTAS